MKYEQYKQLTPEQKEEWQWKFKDNLKVQPILLLSSFLMLFIFISFTLFMLTGYITYTREGLEYIKRYFENVFSISSKLLLILTFTILAELLNYTLRIIYYNWREHKWLKEIKLQNQLRQL